MAIASDFRIVAVSGLCPSGLLVQVGPPTLLCTPAFAGKPVWLVTYLRCLSSRFNPIRFVSRRLEGFGRFLDARKGVGALGPQR